MVYERMHPLEGGLIRIKRRLDRRPGFPIENPLVFYPKLAWEFVTKYSGAYRLHRRYQRILAQVLAEPVGAYADAAMEPVTAGEEQHLEIFTATPAAQQYVEKRRARGDLHHYGAAKVVPEPQLKVAAGSK